MQCDFRCPKCEQPVSYEQALLISARPKVRKLWDVFQSAPGYTFGWQEIARLIGTAQHRNNSNSNRNTICRNVNELREVLPRGVIRTGRGRVGGYAWFPDEDTQ